MPNLIQKIKKAFTRGKKQEIDDKENPLQNSLTTDDIVTLYSLVTLPRNEVDRVDLEAFMKSNVPERIDSLEQCREIMHARSLDRVPPKTWPRLKKDLDEDARFSRADTELECIEDVTFVQEEEDVRLSYYFEAAGVKSDQQTWKINKYD